MVEQVRKQAEELIETGGKAILSVLFPRDFEVYFCSLELCSYEGEMIDYFSFPILPNTVTKKEPYVSNIKKTFGGITVVKNEDFIPQELILRGTFGRSFKILGGSELINVFGVSKYADSSDYKSSEMSNVVKTGYGAIKYLQGIIERSKIFNGPSKLPRILFFHNYMLGESYIVEPVQVQFEQNMGSNMIWNYTLNFTVVKLIDHGRSGGILSLSGGRKLNMKTRLISSATQSTLNSIGQKALNYGASKVRNLL